MSGNHTHYLNAKGEVTKTNLTRKKITPEQKQRTTQKGTYAKGTYAKGIYPVGTYAEGGNKIINTNDINTNDINTNLSFIPQDSLNDIVRKEVDSEEGIPYTYSKDVEKMTLAIHLLTDWNIFHLRGYEDKFKQKTFNLAVESLIEMATESKAKVYNGKSVTYANVIDKINQSIAIENVKNIRSIIEQAVDDFIKASSKKEIKYPRNYIKSCILESFDTHEIKISSFFNRTHYGGIN